MKANPYNRNRSPLNSDINVVPYIDVMLVLLVIFMVTTPMMTSGVDIDLPAENTKNISSSTQLPVVVSLNTKNELYFTDESGEERQVSEEQLKDYLLDKQQQSKNESGQDIQVMLKADKGIAYGKIMSLMASLQKAGIVKVGLITDPNV